MCSRASLDMYREEVKQDLIDSRNAMSRERHSDAHVLHAGLPLTISHHVYILCAY